MNAKPSGLVIYAEVIIYLLHDLNDFIIKSGSHHPFNLQQK